MSRTEDARALARARRNTWTAWVGTHAEMKPDAEAFRYRSRSTTWRELDDRIHRLASALARRGVGRGDRVMLLALNCTEFVETVLATGLLGALAVPVNVRLTPAEIAYLVGDCSPTLVVTDALLAPLVGAVRAEGADPGRHVVIGVEDAGRDTVPEGAEAYEALLAEPGEPAELPDVREDDPALIMYTSGTTGRPKGAVLTYGNLTAQALTVIRAFRHHDESARSLCTPPMFHIAALGAIAPSLQLGTTTVIAPLGAFDPGAVLDLLAEERITGVFMVPVQWQAVCAEQRARPRELCLHDISWGAAPSTDTILRAMSDTFPGVLVCALFGQTEMSPVTCSLDAGDALRKLGSVGTVVPTVQARVVDDFMEDVGPGEVGEIVYRGPNTMLGYWGKPDETADAFDGGWFHSGDLVRQDEEGFVYVVDRKKDMIISGGENIYCAELENVLSAHPRIREAAVVGRRDPQWGEVPVVVAAMGDDGPDLDLDDLRSWLRERVAGYKLPRDLVVVDALPRNASGKVVKAGLRAEHGSSGV